MSADPVYEVCDYESGRMLGGYEYSLVAAERRARWWAARKPRRYAIYRLTPAGRGKGWQNEHVANVIRDALGRLWTDVQIMEPLL